MSGIVEELFIANDSSGTSQVWFRNWSVTASLGLRPFLNANPESVRWGATKDKFVVRTGNTPATQQYYICHIPRAVNTIFGAGVIPTAIIDRIETPATSALAVQSLTTVYTNLATRRSYPVFANDRVTSQVGASCRIDITLTVASTLATSVSESGTATQTKTLANLLAVATSVRYSLNAAGELILCILAVPPGNTYTVTRNDNHVEQDSASPPCAWSVHTTTTTPSISVGPRGETHLWVVNTTVGSVLFRTPASDATVTRTIHDATGSPGPTPGLDPATFGNTTTHRIAFCQGVNDTVVLCGNNLNDLPATPINVDEGIVDTGTEVLNDTIWDTFAFLTGTRNNTFGSSDVTTNLGILAADVSGGSVGITVVTPDGGTTFMGSFKTRTWASTNTPLSYSVLDAYLVDSIAPVKVLFVVSNGTQSALIHLRADGSSYKTLRAFSTGAITVLTANKRHAIWYQNGVVYMTAYDLDINGRTIQIGTSVANAQARRYRLMYPEALLWQGQESSNVSPAGTFLDAWEANGSPTLDDSAPAVFIPLDDFDTLAIVPAGIALPVLPTT